MGPLGAFGIGMGVRGLGSLAEYLGGGARRGRAKDVFNLLKGTELQAPAISDEQIMGLAPYLWKSTAPYRNQLARSASTRLGLDSGAAQGMMAREGGAQMNQLMAQLRQWQLGQNAQKRMQVLQLLSGLAGGV